MTHILFDLGCPPKIQNRHSIIMFHIFVDYDPTPYEHQALSPFGDSQTEKEPDTQTD